MNRSRMNSRSAKKELEQADRRRLIGALQSAELWECQIGVTLERAMLTGWNGVGGCRASIERAVAQCQHEPSGIHERRKRSATGSLTMLANLMPACSPCNLYVEDHPAVAQALGLVVRSGDQDWFMLGADRGGF